MAAAEWWPFDRSWADEWKRNWTEILNMTSAASASMGLPLPKTLPGDPFAAIVEAARGWLIGKKRTFRFSGHELTLVVDDISIQGVDLARVVGQYGQVRVPDLDVHWDGYELERVEVQVRNVHLRPSVRPTLVAAPVLFEAFVSAAAVSRRLAVVSGLLELVLLDGVPPIRRPGAGAPAGAVGGVRLGRGRVPAAGRRVRAARAGPAGRRPADRPGGRAVGAPGSAGGGRGTVCSRPAARPAPGRVAVAAAVPGLSPGCSRPARRCAAHRCRAGPGGLHRARHDRRVAAVAVARRHRAPAGRDARRPGPPGPLSLDP